ncbi:hypothetical protein, partial [Bradyrhizobium sp. JYMT SZCCT0428]|uniref:hypothetical protein n=1 Tax=Bradyrhizobium sp. JYMT SZCCT0428 TaxID=2807673 RepID=UPI001BACECB9
RRIKAGRPWRRSRTIHRKQPTFATKSATSGLMHRSKDRLYSITSSTIEYTLGGTPMRLRRNTPVEHLVEAAPVPPGSDVP